MARKTKTIHIVDGEQELTFELVQMPASKAEKLLNRALLTLVSGGNSPLPPGTNLKTISEKEMAALAIKSLFLLDYEKVEPIYNELLKYARRVVDGTRYENLDLDTLDGVIEDFTTLYKLRKEIVEFNYGFFIKKLGPTFARVKEKFPALQGLLNT